MSDICRCQHAAKHHEYGVGRCRCGCVGYASAEKIAEAIFAKQRRHHGCECPMQNPDCQHPTCPRFPQPGHYHAMVVAVRDLAERARRDGGLLDPYEVLVMVDDTGHDT